MQKIGKCRQNVKMSQKVNIWEGAQCYASHLQIFTREVRWHMQIIIFVLLKTFLDSLVDCAVPENIHTLPHPPQKGSEFPGGWWIL